MACLRGQLPHCPVAVRAARQGCAVQVTLRVHGYTANRVYAVRIVKAVQHGLIAGRIQLEDDSATVIAVLTAVPGATFVGGAVKLAFLVPDDPSVGIIPVRTPAEAIKYSFLLGLRNQFEDCSVAASATGSCGTIKVAASI